MLQSGSLFTILRLGFRRKVEMPSPRHGYYFSFIVFWARWRGSSFRVVSLWQENCPTTRFSTRGDMQCGRNEPRPRVRRSNPVVSSACCCHLLKLRSQFTPRGFRTGKPSQNITVSVSTNLDWTDWDLPKKSKQFKFSQATLTGLV